METYVILRRNGWRSTEQFGEADDRCAAEEARSEEVSRVRSYVVAERDGSVGTVCVYAAASPEAIRRHAAAAGLPLDEILKVVDTVVGHPDPAAVATGKES